MAAKGHEAYKTASTMSGEFEIIAEPVDKKPEF